MSESVMVVLRDGSVIAVIASAIALLTLRFRPRLLMRHYPKVMKDAVPPMTRTERSQALVIGLVMIAVLIGGPAYSTASHIDQVPTFAERFWHAFGVALILHLADWIILDELVIGSLRPRWALLPGTENVPFTFDHKQHFRGFVTGSLLSAVVALVIAALVHP